METNPLLNAGLPVAIAFLMCGIGLHLTLADFRAIARHPRPVLVGIVGHYLLLPLLAFGIAWLLRLPAVESSGAAAALRNVR
jgi:BASS family bile acid:Na+ symporter